MKHPKSFYEDEVIDGFYVGGITKACWAAQLDVLECVDRICKKHGIKWFAEYGTLLGAVRHGGFIPWDDDMDIVMIRDDFNKFTQIAAKELPEGYKVLTFRSEDTDYWEYITRIVNGNEFKLDKDFLDERHGFPFPAGIDIFCLDYVPQKKEDMEIIQTIGSLGQEIVDAIEDGATIQDVESLIVLLEDITKTRIDRDKNIKQQIYVLDDNIFSMYSEEESEYISLMPLWVNTEGEHKYPKYVYSKSLEVDFAGVKIPAPAAYNKMLNQYYGEYIRLVKKGGGHDYPYYKENMEQVIPIAGKAPFTYDFKPIDLDNDERISKRRIDQTATSFCDIFHDAHGEVSLLIGQSRFDEMKQLLADIQGVAINLGQNINQKCGEGQVTVSILEKYCETLYLICQMEESVLTVDVTTVLDEIIDGLKEAIKATLAPKRQILFLPYKYSTWKAMEPAWKLALSDPENEVVVMPTPWFYRTPEGELIEKVDDADQYSSDINIVSFNDYNIEAMHPDEIYIQNPYDFANFSTSVYPAFYSSELKKHTEKLIYIPYFKTDDITEEDERAYVSMDYYVTVPGVVNADEVYVQTDNIRDAYICKLTEMSGEEYRQIWENKIYTVPEAFDYEEDIPDYPPSWNDLLYSEDGSRKKVVAFRMTASSIYENERKAIEKLKNIIRIFKNCGDKILFVWNGDDTILNSQDVLGRKDWNEYMNLVERFLAESWGIYIENIDNNLLSKLSDAYYGVVSPVAKNCMLQNKPVMLIDFNE